MITSLIFDFDGLILDTETPEYLVWQKMYDQYKQPFSVEQWGQIVGGYGISTFDAAENLSVLTGVPAQELNQRQRAEAHAEIERSSIREGVLDYLTTAKKLNLKLAVASSSPHTWVDTHLTRLNLFDYFDAVICRDDVDAGRTKPHPDLFIAALTALQVKPSNAIIFEDSPNGILAAKRAEVFAVAVPNPLTSQLNIQGADLTIPSMQAKRLEEIIQLANARV